MIFVGQAPGPTGDPDLPLANGRVGRRLCCLTGLTQGELLVVERVNLLSAWPGKAGKGDRFPMAEAKRAASDLLPRLVGKRVLVVGQGTARAMGLDPRPLAWRAGFGFRYAVLPHPSGVNHWWNSAENRDAAGAFMRRVGRRIRCRKRSGS